MTAMRTIATPWPRSRLKERTFFDVECDRCGLVAIQLPWSKAIKEQVAHERSHIGSPTTPPDNEKA